MDEKILTVQAPNDTATAMAMMNNNPWMYLVMLALFGNGGFGNNNGAAVNGVLDMETQSKELIAQLDTEYKEKKQNEERFAKIETAQKEQGGKLDRILALLQKNVTI